MRKNETELLAIALIAQTLIAKVQGLEAKVDDFEIEVAELETEKSSMAQRLEEVLNILETKNC